MKRFFMLLFILPFLFFSNPSTVGALTDYEDRKAVLMVMDYIDINDLALASTPNIDSLLTNSGIGLMNIRAKNRYPSSAYMSIAVGYRVGTINRAELSFNIDEPVHNFPNIYESNQHYLTAGEFYQLFTGTNPTTARIVNLFSENIKKNSLLYNPPYEMGQIGKIARNNNIPIGVIGNADTMDTLNRNIAILGMDENGIVYKGDVSSNTTTFDPLVAGGIKSDHEAIAEKFKELLSVAQILLVELGDTTRVEMSRFTTSDEIVFLQRQAAIERNDDLIGELMAQVDLNNTMIIIVTPNPHKEMLGNNNFGLAPVIIHEPTKPAGLLTSSTTRRSGLITNSDILPTIFSFFTADFSANGSQVSIIETDNSLQKLEANLKLYQNLRANRKPLHLLYIGLILLTLALALWAWHSKYWTNNLLDILVHSILLIPILWLFISVTNYESIIISILLTLLSSLVISWALSLFLKSSHIIFAITGITTMLLTMDCFTNSKLMLLSPLGSDAIAGGRYYGIGNDFMGVLLAASVIFITMLVNRININTYLKTSIGFIFLLGISLAIGHPSYGANVGGLITSLVTAGVFVLFMTNRRINVRTFAIIGILAIVGVIGVARLDYLLSTSPSHAGKAINSLLTGGYQIFFSIVKTKLTILANTLFTSNWSIVMLIFIAFLIYVWLKGKEVLALLAVKTPSIMNSIRILIISGITVFIVNDTGVIAFALILTYISALLWVGINEN